MTVSEGKTLVFVELPRGKTLTSSRRLGYRTVALVPQQATVIGAICEDPELLDERCEVASLDPEVLKAEIDGLVQRGHRIHRVLTHCEVLVETANSIAGEYGIGAVAQDAARFRNKTLMKRILAENGIPVARFREVTDSTEACTVAASLGYPVVLKPVAGTGSGSVVRVDDAETLRRAFRGVKLASLATTGRSTVLIEEYLPGEEIGVEALTHRGKTDVVLVSDKPEPMVGPYFEESIYVSPSKLPQDMLNQINTLTQKAVQCLGLISGPSHLEFRIHGERCWILEVAARPGSPFRYVSSSLGINYEELVLRSLDDSLDLAVPSQRIPAGYLLLPIPQTGVLEKVDGLEAALAVPGIKVVRIWKQPGTRVVALPAFDGYLGTIFGVGPDPTTVTQTLVSARQCIRARIRRE